ncbi:hypothetical protein Tsubulata_027516 [Turnera subulata]|uniref:Factor of DNA methylation 1-5/IDN2 domain-containing protein n=1 Tax=Turnera subulata TaxID=218843 RepID=A0A9Q0G916_9ROSI|nr:hypothetical protein Tsubulata_027516 [Turnera subulata]
MKTQRLLQEMKSKYRETSVALGQPWPTLALMLEKITQELEAKSKNLEQLEQELQQRELRIENARKRIRLEQKMTEKTTWEQNKADDSVLKLAEQQKKELDKLHKKIIELGRKLDTKQPLELELECLKGTLQGMEHMGEDEDLKVKKRMDALQEKMKETEYGLADLEKLNQMLLVMMRKSNDEVDARKEVISCRSNFIVSQYLRGNTAPRALIGVKIMGALDSKPFLKEAKRKFQPGEADEKAGELCSQWEEYLRDPSWDPFKVITDGDGNSKYIIDEEDE